MIGKMNFSEEAISREERRVRQPEQGLRKNSGKLKTSERPRQGGLSL